MIKKITNKDKKDWLNFVKSDEKLDNKDSFGKKKNSIPIEKKIDLHGYSLDDANKKIFNFIMSCYEKNVSKITVITGKGSRSKNKENPYQSKLETEDMGQQDPDAQKQMGNERVMELLKELETTRKEKTNAPIADVKPGETKDISDIRNH